MNNIDILSKEEFTAIVQRSYNKTELSLNLGFKYCNQHVWKRVLSAIEKYGLSIEHFDATKQARERRKYEIINKTCPVCSKVFETGKGEAKEKITCSRGCSNTYFASVKYTSEANAKRSATLRDYHQTHEKVVLEKAPVVLHKCVACGDQIPFSLIIDGKLKSFKSRKKCLKCSPFIADTKRGYVDRPTKFGNALTCIRCHKSYRYDRKRGHGLKLCNSCTVNKRRDGNKQWAINYMGGACQNCGYDKCARALCFHHLDPAKKDMSVNAASAAHSQKVRQGELDKCVLLCANCHMEEHDKLIKEREERRMIATDGAVVAQFADNG